jgi:hypothetical protein
MFQNPPARQILASELLFNPRQYWHELVIDIDMILDLRPCNHTGASSSHPLVTRLYFIFMCLPKSGPIRLLGKKMNLLQPAFSGDPQGSMKMRGWFCSACQCSQSCYWIWHIHTSDCRCNLT